MPAHLASAVTITEEPPRSRTLESPPTATLAALGLTQKGPIRTPIAVTSFAEFVRIFGYESEELALQIRQFFLNGGQLAYISRVVHYTNPATPTPATASRGSLTLQSSAGAPGGAVITGSVVGPYAVVDGDSLRIVWTDNDESIAPGGGGGADSSDETLVVDVSAATITSGSAENYDLTGGGILPAPWRLAVKIDGGALQNVDLEAGDFVDPAAATAEEVAAAINGHLIGAFAAPNGPGTHVVLTSYTRGTASSVDIDAAAGASDANTALGFALAAATGTGHFHRGADPTELASIADANAVSLAEIIAGLQALDTDMGAWPAGHLTFTSSSGFLRITTAATGATAHVAIPDKNGAGTVTMVLATTLGFAQADNAGGIDMTPPVEANVESGTTGSAVDTLKVEGKYEGSYSSDLQIVVRAASSSTASEFDLDVYRSGSLEETFPNVTMDSTADRYVETIIGDTGAYDNGESNWIRVTDQAAVGTPTQRRPANTAAMPWSPSLTAGNDGLTALADGDYTGDEAGQTGLRAFDPISGLRILICPDTTSSTVQNAMTAFAQTTREAEMLAILDPPAGQDAAGIVAQRALLTSTEHGVLYWPRVKVATPSEAYGSEALYTTCPSGSIAGLMARNDLNTRPGPFMQPAGTLYGALQGVVDVETTDVLRVGVRNMVFPQRINPIMVLPGLPVHVDGARTLLGTSNFPSVGERRGVSDIEATIRAGLLVYRNRNNTPDLRREIATTLFQYLAGRTRDGCFASMTPSTAFYVDVSDSLNPPSQRNRIVVRIGLATTQPAEYIDIYISQDTRAIDEALSAP